MTDPLAEFRLDGEVAVVTGGASGLGRAVARLGEPQDIVGAVLFLASRASALVTGHVLAVDGGFLAQ